MTDTLESSARLYANIGDRLVVSPVDLAVDKVASVEVVGVSERGMPRVVVKSGEIGTGSVWVQQANKAKSR